jgi:hypothetical protein
LKVKERMFKSITVTSRNCAAGRSMFQTIPDLLGFSRWGQENIEVIATNTHLMHQMRRRGSWVDE